MLNSLRAENSTSFFVQKIVAAKCETSRKFAKNKRKFSHFFANVFFIWKLTSKVFNHERFV